MTNRVREPHLYEIMIILTIFLASALWAVSFNISISIPMLITWFAMMILGWMIGLHYLEMQHAIKEGIFQGLDAFLIIIFIGALIGTWIRSGLVVTIIYYGLQTITPWLFLPCTTLLCALTSLATGTSVGTAGTIGIAMMEIGRSMGIPAPAIAGAILSGAYFGDKLSLLSDSVILASSMSKVDIYKHVKGLLPISVPSFIIAMIGYYILNQGFTSDIINLNQSASIASAINENFYISSLSLFPVFVVIFLLSFQLPTVPVLAVGSLAGIVCGILVQGLSIHEAISSIYSNNITSITQTELTSSTAIYLQDLMSRGGIESMLSSLITILLGLGLSGLMDKLNFMKIISYRIKSGIDSVHKLNIWTMFVAILGNILGGTMYVSLIMTPKLMRKIYDDMGADRRILARSTEIGGTLTCAMIPWTDNGIYMAKILGVSYINYVPYMFLAIIAIILNIIYGYFDLFMWKHKGIKS